jgi:BNR repeat-containing family member
LFIDRDFLALPTLINGCVMFQRFKCSSIICAFLILPLAELGVLSSAYGVDVSTLNIALGYATADTNTMPFASYSVITSGNYQFVTYYNTLQHVTIARRQLGTTTWSTTDTGFTANDITDDHDMISIGIDGNGIMHMSWGMHNNSLKYTTTTASVLNNNPISFNSSMASSMPISAPSGGYTNEITYPQFYNIPGSGDLLFWYRVGGAGGGSGNGNLNLNRYSAATGTWSEVKAPVLDGITNSVNAYPNTMVINSQGIYEISWTWRATSDYQSNSNICYAQSTNGTTWTSITGAAINSGSGAIGLYSPNQTIVSIPQGSSLMNQTSMTNDLYGHPMIATYWAPGGNTDSGAARQYELVYYNGTSWQTSQVTNRPREPKITDNNSTHIREMGRPVVLSDQDNRTLMIVRYNEDRTTGTKDIFGTTYRNNIIVYYSTDNQHWSFLDLTPNTDMGQYEANYDPVNWKQNGVLDLFYQQVPNTQTSTMVSLLEWNARSYFITNTIWDWKGGNSSAAANSAANWLVGGYSVTHAPSGAGYNFSFGNQSAANSLVDLTSAGLTAGDITFAAGTSTTIQSTGGYNLILDNLGSASTISVAGTHTISAPVLINNDVNVSGAGTLNLSGGISGSHTLDVLSGNVTAKNISVDTLTIGSGAAVTIAAIPGGPQSGDIMPVPEPSSFVLLAIGALFSLCYCKLKNANFKLQIKQ